MGLMIFSSNDRILHSSTNYSKAEWLVERRMLIHRRSLVTFRLTIICTTLIACSSRIFLTTITTPTRASPWHHQKFEISPYQFFVLPLGWSNHHHQRRPFRVCSIARRHTLIALHNMFIHDHFLGFFREARKQRSWEREERQQEKSRFLGGSGRLFI